MFETCHKWICSLGYNIIFGPSKNIFHVQTFKTFTQKWFSLQAFLSILFLEQNQLFF